MYLEVYPDIIFVLNLIYDFIILTLLKWVNHKYSPVRRRMAASVVGAIAAVIIGLYPWINIIVRFISINVVTSIIMMLIAFGRMKKMELLKQGFALYLITYSIGGFINSVYYHTNLKLYLLRIGNSVMFSNLSWKFVLPLLLLLLPIGFLVLWLYRCFSSNQQDIYEIEVSMDQQTVKTQGLMDTGNCLYDPIFHKPVIIMEETLLENLLSSDSIQEYQRIQGSLDCKEQNLEQWNIEPISMLRYRIIPYQSIGKKQGMMLGLILDKVIIHKKEGVLSFDKVTAAICDNHLSTKDEYHVILHKGLIS